MSLCSWLVEGIGGKGSSAGLLPGSIEAPDPCVENMDGCLINWQKSHFPFLCQYVTGYHPRMGLWGGPSEATTLWYQSH